MDEPAAPDRTRNGPERRRPATAIGTGNGQRSDAEHPTRNRLQRQQPTTALGTANGRGQRRRAIEPANQPQHRQPPTRDQQPTTAISKGRRTRQLCSITAPAAAPGMALGTHPIE